MSHEAKIQSPLMKTGVAWEVVFWMTTMHILAIIALPMFSWTNFAVMVFIYFMTGCVGVTLTYHRLLTHRAYRVPKWLERVLATIGVLAMQGSPGKWVAHHRMHHAFSDTEKDPHDATQGFWHSHMGWLFMNRPFFDDLDRQRKFARDIFADPYYRLYQSNAAQVGLTALLGVLLYFIGGWSMVLWGICVRMVVVYHVTWLVNSAAHIWGYRNYEVADDARNNWVVAALAFGEGWHNNHHAHGDVAPAGHRWWEFDITFVLIRAMIFLGLAKDVKLPPSDVLYDSFVNIPESVVRPEPVVAAVKIAANAGHY